MSEAIAKPQLDVAGEVYRFTWPFGIEAELERFAEHRDELSAELTIVSRRPPAPGLLHSARLNLMSSQTRRSLVQSLLERDGELDWAAIVEQICFLARERYRNGEPAVDLREPLEAPPQRWTVEPFVEHEGAAIVFADGGTGKSFIALAIAVTAACDVAVLGRRHGSPRPVLYLDWETSHWTMHERLDAIAKGAGLDERPPIFYRHMSASLVEAAANVRRDVAQLGIGLVVVDSLGAARAGEPESADMTIRLFNAARSFGVPWVGVDHVTKSAGNDSTRPFGSTYTHNLARLTWGADKAQEEGENALVVSLTNRKRNNGRLLPRMGFRLEFESGAGDELRSVRFRRADLTSVPGLAEKGSLRERILAELRDGGVDQDVLVERLGVGANQVRARVSELERRQVLRRDPETGLIWIASERPA